MSSEHQPSSAGGTHSQEPGAHSRARRNAGITLIELGFVVGIIAVIVVGVLTIYNSVTAQQAVTDVTSDVAAIRTAVSTWASGRPLRLDGAALKAANAAMLDTEWDNWADISNYLPGDLGQQAESQTGKTLTKVSSSWPEVSYMFQIGALAGAGVDNTYLWTLTIDMIPDQDDATTLGKRLLEGAEELKVTKSDSDNASIVAVTYSL